MDLVMTGSQRMMIIKDAIYDCILKWKNLMSMVPWGIQVYESLQLTFVAFL